MAKCEQMLVLSAYPMHCISALNMFVTYESVQVKLIRVMKLSEGTLAACQRHASTAPNSYVGLLLEVANGGAVASFDAFDNVAF